MTGQPDLTQLPAGLLSMRADQNRFFGSVLDLTQLPVGLTMLSFRENSLKGEVVLGNFPASLLTLRLDVNLFSEVVVQEGVGRTMVVLYQNPLSQEAVKTLHLSKLNYQLG